MLIGLDYDYEAEDLKHIRELVLLRMNELFVSPSQGIAARASFVGQFVQSATKRGDLKGVTYLK